MKYLSVIVVFALLISSCEKPSSNNLSRSVMLGHYHFTTIAYDQNQSKNGFDTGRYDGMVTIALPDNGNNISITYPDTSQQTVCQTSDSTFASIAYICPNNSLPISGRYQHDTLFMTDHSYGCESNNPNLYVTTIGIKY